MILRSSLAHGVPQSSRANISYWVIYFYSGLEENSSLPECWILNYTLNRIVFDSKGCGLFWLCSILSLSVQNDIPFLIFHFPVSSLGVSSFGSLRMWFFLLKCGNPDSMCRTLSLEIVIASGSNFVLKTAMTYSRDWEFL